MWVASASRQTARHAPARTSAMRATATRAPHPRHARCASLPFGWPYCSGSGCMRLRVRGGMGWGTGREEPRCMEGHIAPTAAARSHRLSAAEEGHPSHLHHQQRVPERPVLQRPVQAAGWCCLRHGLAPALRTWVLQRQPGQMSGVSSAALLPQACHDHLSGAGGFPHHKHCAFPPGPWTLFTNQPTVSARTADLRPQRAL